MDTVVLPPELEQFAAGEVAAGRYRDIGELLVASVDLLRRLETQREEFRASVMAAEAEGERNGFLSIEEVMRNADAVIEEMAGPQR